MVKTLRVTTLVISILLYAYKTLTWVCCRITHHTMTVLDLTKLLDRFCLKLAIKPNTALKVGLTVGRGACGSPKQRRLFLNFTNLAT